VRGERRLDQLGLHPNHWVPSGRRSVGEPGDLAVEVRALVVGGDTRVEAEPNRDTLEHRVGGDEHAGLFTPTAGTGKFPSLNDR